MALWDPGVGSMYDVRFFRRECLACNQISIDLCPRFWLIHDAGSIMLRAKEKVVFCRIGAVLAETQTGHY